MTLWGFEGDRCYCWNDKKKIACRIFDTLTRGKSPPFRSPASHPSPAMCPVSGGGGSPTSWKSLESSMLIHQWSSSLVAFIVILSCCRLNHSDLAGWQTFFSLPWGKKKYAPGHHLKLSLGVSTLSSIKSEKGNFSDWNIHRKKNWNGKCVYYRNKNNPLVGHYLCKDNWNHNIKRPCLGQYHLPLIEKV